MLFVLDPWQFLVQLVTGCGRLSDTFCKSVLDGFISIAFASTLGMGVAFSALPVLAYQEVLASYC
jgi:uncharacterized membrane protein YqgA involved in biofilm formation